MGSHRANEALWAAAARMWGRHLASIPGAVAVDKARKMYLRKGRGGVAALVAGAAAASGRAGPSTLRAAAPRTQQQALRWPRHAPPGRPRSPGARRGGSGALATAGRVGGDSSRAGGGRSVRQKGGRGGYGGGRGPCTPAADAQERCRSRRGYAWRDDGQDLRWWRGRRVMRTYGCWPRATPVSRLAASVEGGGRYRRQCLGL
jgi:hypothetical protein